MIAKILQNKKIIASTVVILLVLFVIYSALPFISAFFGALILAFIFNPLNKWFRKKGLSKQLAAWIILIIALILIIIPLYFLIQGLVEQIKILPDQLAKIDQERLSQISSFEINLDKNFIVNQVIPLLTKSVTPFFSNIIQAFAVSFLLFFLLYYFLIYADELRDKIYEIIPFNKEHKIRTLQKFRAITYSTIIGTFFIALIQGGLIALNFYFLGIPNALFWGFVTMILSFLPIVGAPIIWIPTGIFLFIGGRVTEAIAIILIGIMISTIDNILRPIINDRYGKIHPLISIVGIYIGIVQFGFVGIFIGPLIVAYMVLFWQMYKEEYMKKGKKIKPLK